MSDVIDRFTAMSAAQVNEYFRTSDVLDITTMIRGASEEELRRLIDLDHFREEALHAILDRFADFSDAERLAAVDGVVRFELARSQKQTECHTARFSAGNVILEPEAVPDVTIAADILDFVRLVTGESNAALLYLGGKLGIKGREMLALDVGTVFTVPGNATRPSIRPLSIRSMWRLRWPRPRASTCEQ
ncbi:MAG: SCP2 sterol-binding domain-containing protein [Marmoricola sp.]